LHAGDLTSINVIDELSEICPCSLQFKVNMDRARRIKLPIAETIEVEGLKIGTCTWRSLSESRYTAISLYGKGIGCRYFSDRTFTSTENRTN
jgi:hypothetical protein